jgi:glycine cleavage system H protein
MNYPDHLHYTKDHEWALFKGTEVTVGITDHAQSALGDIVFVELPQVGRKLKQGETFGVVESIKAVSDLYSPLNGTILSVNQSVIDNPSSLNQDPHTDAWLVKIESGDSISSLGLMDSKKYSEYVKSLK